MRILVFLSQKGGSGKTTLVVHTAVAAAEAGLDVLVVDTDPQQSATVWSNARTADTPIVATVAATDLERVLTAARDEGIDLAIIDTAPHAAPEAARIARAADLVLIPCRPTAFDLAAAEQAARIVKAAGAQSAFVLSACPVRAPEIGETRKALGDYGLPVTARPVAMARENARRSVISAGAHRV